MMGLDHDQAVAYRGRADGPSFVQKFPAAAETSKKAGATATSEKWRTLAAWATVLSMVARGLGGGEVLNSCFFFEMARFFFLLRDTNRPPP